MIPEEYSTLALPAQKRSQIRAELAGSLRHVLPLIQQVLDYQQSSNRVDSENAMQAIKCLQAWVQFGVPMEEMSPLIDRVLAAVREEELFDCSLDALSSIVSHPDTHKYVNLLKHLLERILTLEPLLSQLVNEGKDNMNKTKIFQTYFFIYVCKPHSNNVFLTLQDPMKWHHHLFVFSSHLVRVTPEC